MDDAIIRKGPADLKVTPNLDDYDATRASFAWSQVPDVCAGMGSGGCNIAYAAVDRHAEGPGAERTALRFIADDPGSAALRTHDVSYAELGRLTRTFTNVLRDLGIGKGDKVFVIMGRVPELYISMLGALRNGSVVSPLFSAFGPEPIATRVNIGAADVLVTTAAIYRRKISRIRDQLPSVKHVLIVGDEELPGTHNFHALMDRAGDDAPIEHTGPDDPSLLHFTSGTTGTPKGAQHVHAAVAMHYITGLFALDLHPGDIYWCTADPGWVTGTAYGIIAPLLHGVTSIIDEAEFDAEHWYRILQDEGVTVWYTAPTAIRMLIKAGPELAGKYTFPHLRFVASVGEPLNAEAVWWGKRVLGLPIHDNWWQTETGGIMVANTPAFDIKPGAMGRPLPGVDVVVVDHDDAEEATGAVNVIDAPDVEGELALRVGWPSMFRGYLDQDQRYRKCFSNDLYLTGDLVRRDTDGYLWFVGRADDVIKASGHLIGPFEVENVLTDHPAVAEAGVIGKPDPTYGAVVKAFVTLKSGYTGDDHLRRDLMGHARKRLGAAVAPKEIDFVDSLPHTRSGKIMRRLLKARELGLPEGDISTVETPGAKS
jgi:acetyl-CoA synthetase